MTFVFVRLGHILESLLRHGHRCLSVAPAPYRCALCGKPLGSNDVAAFDLPRRFCERCALSLGELTPNAGRPPGESCGGGRRA